MITYMKNLILFILFLTFSKTFAQNINDYNHWDCVLQPANLGLSENSVFISHTDPNIVLSAHNASNGLTGRVAATISLDGGTHWENAVEMPNADTDPACAIDRGSIQGDAPRYYVAYIGNNRNQVVSYTDDIIPFSFFNLFIRLFLFCENVAFFA